MNILIPLISRDMGAALMVGLVTGIGLMLYDYIKNTKQRNEEKQRVKTIRENDRIENERFEKINALKELKNKGIISEDEYRSKKAHIEREYNSEEIKKTTEYEQLKNLYNQGVFTQEEFDRKVESLIKRKSNGNSPNNNNYNNDFHEKLDLSNLSSIDFLGKWLFDQGFIEFIDIYNFKLSFSSTQEHLGQWDFKSYDNLIELNLYNQVDQLKILQLRNNEMVFILNKKKYKARRS